MAIGYISTNDCYRPNNGPYLHRTAECATRGHVWDAVQVTVKGGRRKRPNCLTCGGPEIKRAK